MICEKKIVDRQTCGVVLIIILQEMNLILDKFECGSKRKKNVIHLKREKYLLLTLL